MLTAHNAVTWMRAHSGAKGRQSFFKPSTPQLRRWLRDKRTPRGVKGHLWSFLRYRLETL